MRQWLAIVAKLATTASRVLLSVFVSVTGIVSVILAAYHHSCGPSTLFCTVVYYYYYTETSDIEYSQIYNTVLIYMSDKLTE